MDVGTILRLWREEVARLSQAEAARALNLTPQALNQWERGSRSPARGQLAAVDSLYRARGALFDHCLAVATSATFAPRLVWSHNFTEEDGPVWAWLRPTPDNGRISAELSWATVHVRIDQPCTADGVLLVSPVSLANPPLDVRMDVPGWVDFGRGVPSSALGIPIIDATQIVPTEVSEPEESSWLFDRSEPLFHRLQMMFRRLSGSRISLRPYFSSLAPLMGGEPFEIVSSDEQPPELTVDHDELRRIREARDLSRDEVARAASGLDPDHPVDPHILRHLEEGRAPHVLRLLSRLDMVYGGDGRLCNESVHVDRVGLEQWVARFPSYWIGPVWARFYATRSSDRPVADVVITWFPWRKKLRLYDGTTLHFRRATHDAAPPDFVVSPGWRVEAGLGLPRNAHDVNVGWRPAGRRGVVVLLTHGLQKALVQTAEAKVE